MVRDGAIRCRMAPDMAGFNRKKPNGAGWYQMIHGSRGQGGEGTERS